MIPARLRIPLFVLLCAAQLAFAVSIIVGAERVLGQGELWRFRTEPVDPADIVRGRYVALRFEATNGPVLPGDAPQEGTTGYALLDADTEGFAHVAAVSATPPGEGSYLRVEIERVDAETASFAFPVDRFYMPEELAPEAERAHGKAQRAGEGTWAEIRVHDGAAMIEQLFVRGVPVAELVRGATTEAPER